MTSRRPISVPLNMVGSGQHRLPAVTRIARSATMTARCGTPSKLVISACDPRAITCGYLRSERDYAGTHGRQPQESMAGISAGQRSENVVVRGRIELPTFRFSGLRITVQDEPQRSLCLLGDLRYTHMDADVRGCMRLGMRLLRPVLPAACSPGRSCTGTPTSHS
jgi:hypothetical protein